MANFGEGRLIDSTDSKNAQNTAYKQNSVKYTTAEESNSMSANWGVDASRSLYSSHINLSSNADDKGLKGRCLLDSRLWKGVPQLTEEMMSAFEAAYSGHTFVFCIGMPKFLTTGIYLDTNAHYLMKNFKAIMERASTSVSGGSDYTVEFDQVTDGPGQKIDHVKSVYKEQNDISVRLHEFAGLPVKNALETWLTGIYDPKSQHGSYHGNLGIPGGWSLTNHSMSMLVVQVNPSWTEIQDAVYYYNMVPTMVPMAFSEWTKGEYSVIDNIDISFKCNEERSPAITYAAEKFVNNRILSFASTSMFNSRQFVVYKDMISNSGSGTNDHSAISGETQYNIKLKNLNDNPNPFVSLDTPAADDIYDGYQDKTEPDVQNSTTRE